MQPQMPFFLGREPPPAPLTTTAQKCFRTPDIDEVGLDTYHLTFFEMLGNFSFGQYFKEGAIEYATEFIRERLKLDWDRIWASVHAGDPELKLGPDEEAIELWEKIGMPPERIVPLPSSENFWSVGGPGPCGPDSEIYYDWGAGGRLRRARLPARLHALRAVPRVLEPRLHGVRAPSGRDADRRCRSRTSTPAWGSSARRGSSRTSPSVYDTDGYQRIMSWIAQQSGVAYGDSADATKAHRVLADHGRGMTFLVGEGVTPSNEGRGYVLRRDDPPRGPARPRGSGCRPRSLPGLAGAVIEQMATPIRSSSSTASQIERILRAEEERFGETLERGMKLFEEAADRGAISGEDAFTLQATYGFPIELTVELARERGHRRSTRTSSCGRWRGTARSHARAAARARPSTPPISRAAAGFVTDFVGWEKTEVLTQIGALEELGDGTFLAKLRESPFYAEGGGQVTDAGELERDDGGVAALRAAYRVDDDQALVFEGEGFAKGDRVKALVPWNVALPDDGQPHGDPPAARGATDGAR